MRLLQRFMLVILSLVILKCGNKKNEDCAGRSSYSIIDLTGLDGCGLLLENTDGERFEAFNLGQFIDDPQVGQTVNAKLMNRNDLAGICGAGKIVEIICIH